MGNKYFEEPEAVPGKTRWVHFGNYSTWNAADVPSVMQHGRLSIHFCVCAPDRDAAVEAVESGKEHSRAALTRVLHRNGTGGCTTCTRRRQ